MFTNRIRLPLQLHSPQFPEERDIFRKANGETVTMSVIVRKTYELETDFMPEKWHQRTKIAIAHDNVTIEGERYLGLISQDGDYQIEWPEGVLHYPTAKAVSKVQVTPFDATNSNCQTCQEATQLTLADDIAQGIYGPLEENTEYEVNAADNDNICCYPAVFSLVSYNTDYLTSASIDPATGVLTLQTGSDLVSANSIVLAAYRVTCPNGGYDEADVTGDINGSIEGCLAPSGLVIGSNQPESAVASWTEAEPGSTYYWELYEGSSPVGSPVQSGSVTGDEVSLTGLTPGTGYYFQVRTVCYGSNSNFIGTLLDTPAQTENCGEYQITYARPLFEGFLNVVYTDCNGDAQLVQIPNNSSRTICALQNSPGDPVNIGAGGPFVTVTYIGEC